MQTKVVYCRNLPHDCTEEELGSIAIGMGEVMAILTVQGKGYGLIEMADITQAANLIDHYQTNDCQIRGRDISLEFSKSTEIKSRYFW